MTGSPDAHLSSAAHLREAVAEGEVSAVAAARSALARIAALDPALGAFITVDEAGAIAAAEAVDAKRARGETLGPLAGVPVGVKDNLVTAGLRTTCGSRMLADHVPPYDATVVARLRAADAVVVGKLAMDEFAMGSSGEHTPYRVCRNPWDLTRVAGGSSSGAAAAVAAGLCPLALGSDTGGSVRLPAAFCGVVGVKPTYGRVSRYGLVAFASSLDQVGPLARDVGDAALLLAVIAGHDPRDATSAARPVPDYGAALRADLRGRRVGVVRDALDEGLDAEVEAAVRAALATFEDAGARLVDVVLPHTRHAIAAYYLIATAEASSNLARFDGVRYGRRAPAETVADLNARSRGEGLGEEVKRRILLGTFALSKGYHEAYYGRAERVRTLVRRDLEAAFARCDLLVGPTAPTPAFPLGARTRDPVAMYRTDVHTVAASLAGLPALSVPCGFTAGGLPLGLHLMGPPFAEQALLDAAYAYELRTDWRTPWPPLAARAGGPP